LGILGQKNSRREGLAKKSIKKNRRGGGRRGGASEKLTGRRDALLGRDVLWSDWGVEVKQEFLRKG